MGLTEDKIVYQWTNVKRKISILKKDINSLFPQKAEIYENTILNYK